MFTSAATGAATASDVYENRSRTFTIRMLFFVTSSAWIARNINKSSYASQFITHVHHFLSLLLPVRWHNTVGVGAAAAAVTCVPRVVVVLVDKKRERHNVCLLPSCPSTHRARVPCTAAECTGAHQAQPANGWLMTLMRADDSMRNKTEPHFFVFWAALMWMAVASRGMVRWR